jgi:hypothetical protein
MDFSFGTKPRPGFRSVFSSYAGGFSVYEAISFFCHVSWFEEHIVACTLLQEPCFGLI